MTRPPDSSSENPSGHQMEPRRTFLSVVVPCFNESEVIGLFFADLSRTLESLDVDFEIILVDDGSCDDTLTQLNRFAERDENVRVCSLSRNFGHQIALTAGLDFAEGDAVVMMDSDLQHPPSLIPEMVEQWRAGYDVVSALRQRTEKEPLLKKLTSVGFYKLLNYLSKTKLEYGVADFCLLSRPVYGALRQMPERHRFLRGLVAWVGFKRTFVSYQAPARIAGSSKYTSRKMIALALDAIFSFSAEPLKLAWRLGLLIVALGFGYLAWTLVQGYLRNALVPGYASLIAVVMILGGAQLAFLGLIGQYLARIFEQVKQRPAYLLKQKPRPSRRSSPMNQGRQLR